MCLLQATTAKAAKTANCADGQKRKAYNRRTLPPHIFFLRSFARDFENILLTLIIKIIKNTFKRREKS
jgi:hypothetical protein